MVEVRIICGDGETLVLPPFVPPIDTSKAFEGLQKQFTNDFNLLDDVFQALPSL